MEKKGYWFSTENGTHIFVEEGQSKEQAMNKVFDGKTSKPSADLSEIEKRKTETPQESYARMKEQWRKEREELNKKNEKPLHIQSLEKQVSKNPDYKKIADSLTDDKETNEAFFYAFKDAYERHNYEPSNKHIADELSNKYWELANGYQDRYGMSDRKWDEYGMSDFEEAYGTEEEFVDKGLNAHNKYFDELESKKEQDFNDPMEAEHNKAEEKEWSSSEDDIWNSFEKGEITEKERNQKLSDRTKNLAEHDFNNPLERESLKVEDDQTPYKSKYKAEDFEDARFYPTESTMDKNNRWVGRYHSIHDAFDGQPIDDFGNDKFKSVGSYNGTSIYQLPDGYYSINPRITSMSFKTKEALQNYLDKKNPEEHKYGLYSDNGIMRDYRGKDENGKEYGMEGPDAYKTARTKNDGLFNSYLDKVKKSPKEDLKFIEKDLETAKLSQDQKNKIKEHINKKIKEQVNDGATESDLGYFRNIFQDIPGFNNISDEELRKRIERIRRGN